MYDYNILTKKTPIVCVTKRNDAIAEMSFMPEIYHKAFDINEFIGEELAGIRGIKSAHYFPLSFSNIKDIRSGKVPFNKDTIRVGSYSFREKGKAYLVEPFLSFEFDDMTFEMMLEQYNTLENKEMFLRENLEMFGLDIYMGQQDRPLNCYYVYDEETNEVHLGPLFDYEDSLYVPEDNEFEYRSDFVYFNSIDDYQEMMVKYPVFEEILRSYTEVQLIPTIKFMGETRGFDLSKFDLDPYKRFEEHTQKRLEKILK